MCLFLVVNSNLEPDFQTHGNSLQLFFYAPRCLIEKKLKTVIENYLNITHKYTLVYYSKIDFKILAKVIQILQVIFINLNF